MMGTKLKIGVILLLVSVVFLGGWWIQEKKEDVLDYQLKTSSVDAYDSYHPEEQYTIIGRLGKNELTSPAYAGRYVCEFTLSHFCAYPTSDELKSRLLDLSGKQVIARGKLKTVDTSELYVENRSGMYGSLTTFSYFEMDEIKQLDFYNYSRPEKIIRGLPFELKLNFKNDLTEDIRNVTLKIELRNNFVFSEENHYVDKFSLVAGEDKQINFSFTPLTEEGTYITIKIEGLDGINVFFSDDVIFDTFISRDFRKWITYHPVFGKSTDKKVLPDETINAMAVDDDGVIWIGTDNGVSRFNGKEWSSNTDSDLGLDGRIYSIAVDGNKVYFVTRNGVVEYDKSEDTWDILDKTKGMRILSIAAKNGVIWIGTDGQGGYKFNGEVWEFIHQLNNTHAIAVDNQGNLWCGGYGTGLFRFDGIDWQYSTWSAYSAVGSNSVVSLVVDENTVWMGAVDGLYRMPSFYRICTESINTIAVDGDIIWVGTPKGVWKYDKSNPDLVAYTIYLDENSGLPNNFVQSIVVTPTHIWFGTDNGLASMEK